MPKITTFFMFNDQAEAAMNFYVSVFKNSRIDQVMRQGDAVMGGSFHLDGVEYMCYNGGPHFTFAEGMSQFIHCEDQAEVDYYWEKLTEGGEEQPCGWVKDKFGVSWQIIPDALMRMISDPEPVKAQRATEAMLQMHKIDVATLERAYNQA
jgi:predicted 3-demethylubiquinone-9 3-methyltransferase (glyoxalase superfamily)